MARKKKLCKELTGQKNHIVCLEDCTELLAYDCIAPVDIPKQQLLHPEQKIVPHFEYDSFDFAAGEVLEVLPESDAKLTAKKIAAHKLSETYVQVHDAEKDNKMLKRWGRRVSNTAHCGDLVKMKGDVIYKTLFCKTRLCPVCSWRREIKISIHTRQILAAMLEQEKRGFKFLFLTLTVRNVWDCDMMPHTSNNVFDRMLYAWHKLTTGSTAKYAKWFNSFVLGWYRGLEVTRNLDKYKVDYVTDQKTGKKKKVIVRDLSGDPVPNKWYLSWHPHFHCILVVPEDFEFDKDALEAEFLQAWQTCYGDPTITQVDVREFKANKKILENPDLQKKFSATELQSMAIVSGVVEAAKYTVKSSDYMLDPKATRLLDLAIERRRLVAYGGLMKEYHNKLHLDDEIDGDLLCNNAVQVDKDAPEKTYAFSVGFKQYIRIDGRK